MGWTAHESRVSMEDELENDSKKALDELKVSSTEERNGAILALHKLMQIQQESSAAQESPSVNE